MTTHFLFAMHNVNIFGATDNYTAGREYAIDNPNLFCFFYHGVHDSYEDQSDKDWKTPGRDRLCDLGHELTTLSDMVAHYFDDTPFDKTQFSAGYEVAKARYDASYLFFKGIIEEIMPYRKHLNSRQSTALFEVETQQFLSKLAEMWALSYDKMRDEFEVNPPLIPKLPKSGASRIDDLCIVRIK